MGTKEMGFGNSVDLVSIISGWSHPYQVIAGSIWPITALKSDNYRVCYMHDIQDMCHMEAWAPVT